MPFVLLTPSRSLCDTLCQNFNLHEGCNTPEFLMFFMCQHLAKAFLDVYDFLMFYHYKTNPLFFLHQYLIG